MTVAETFSDAGLSIDALDVDRLEDWARNIETHGADLTQWGYPQFIVETLRDIAERMREAIVDIGKLRSRTPQSVDVDKRITAYLSTGGLFNPELAKHDEVSRLLLDARSALAALAREVETLKHDLCVALEVNATLTGTIARLTAENQRLKDGCGKPLTEGQA
jgi:hypothetical protein